METQRSEYQSSRVAETICKEPKLHTKGKLEISFSSQLSVHTVDWTYCPSLLPLKGENVPHADLQLQQSAECIHK